MALLLAIQPAAAPPLRLTRDKRATFWTCKRGSRPLHVSLRSSLPDESVRICILGAGVIGLTSALRILQSNHRCKLTVMADKFGAETTSSGAAGIWQPYKVSNTPEEKLHRWGDVTFRHLLQLYQSQEAALAGVALVAGQSLFTAPEPDPFWKDSVLTFGRLRARTLDVFSRGRQFLDGYHYTTIVCEGRLYLPWLTARVEGAGGTIMRRAVTCLEELQEDFDIVVDCCGLLAPRLFPQDQDQCYPIRGQIIRVRAPWVTQAYFADPFYIIPNREWVVLGGTAQYGNSSTEVSEDDKAHIWQGCCDLLPGLKQSEVVGDWVGLRPGRREVRLEAEKLPRSSSRSGELLLVHNYGHGGSGLTLAWGCAEEVVDVISQHLRGGW